MRQQIKDSLLKVYETLEKEIRDDLYEIINNLEDDLEMDKKGER